MALDFWRIACYYGEVETCGHIRVQVLLIGVDLNKKNRGEDKAGAGERVWPSNL